LVIGQQSAGKGIEIFDLKKKTLKLRGREPGGGSKRKDGN